MSSHIDAFFQHYITIKLFHFQTNQGFRHVKIDKYTGKFLENFDQFMEVFQGEFGTIDTKVVKIEVKAKDDVTILKHFDEMIDFLRDLRADNQKLSTELQTIRDQMLIDLQQIKYLFTFQ